MNKNRISTTRMKQIKNKSEDQAFILFQINRRVREASFILLSALSFYLLITLLTYASNDPGWSHTGTSEAIVNAGGKTGAYSADFLFYLFGYMAYFLPIALFYGAIVVYQENIQFFQGNPWIWFLRTFGLLLATGAGSGLMSLHIRMPFQALPTGNGGILGSIIESALVTHFDNLGGSVFLLSFTLIGITFYTGISWLKLLDKLGKQSIIAFIKLKNISAQIFCKFLESSKKYRVFLKKEIKAKLADIPKLIASKPKAFDSSQNEKNEPFSFEKDCKPVINIATSHPITDLKPTPIPQPAVIKLKKKPVSLTTLKPDENVTTAPLEAGKPSLSLLESVAEVEHQVDEKQLEHLSALVETRLNEFNITVKVVAVYPGPVITRFELDLAPGLKVSKITGLAKDLARSLSVEGVRVVEVIPGKSVVGLEIPNQQREIVRLKEILASSQYQQHKSPLALGLGKSISGEPVSVNLAKMPHLLVAGTTGSGKSVGINAMILSILYKSSAEQVRLILIDPKMLELSVYEGIPHLLTPVVTDMKDAANSLRWCVGEMERRYQLMAAVGVRNLEGYNAKVEKAIKMGDPLFDPLWEPHLSESPEELETLPFIVVVIDEFADMMMVVGKKVEELIARIAQKARAAGIHLILATQRPSVDVITGLIKANIPTRIAFQVSSRIDSRTILDQHGAEQLLGHGDMLYLPAGRGLPERIHGAFVADEEVHKVIASLRQAGEPNYLIDFKQGTSNLSALNALENDEDYDELYDEAVKIVTESRRASISHVQRRLKIGYNRAARMIERMESDGVVTPMQSNGSREVLAPPPIET